MDGENCADGCGRRGCKGVAGNGSGEEAAGDERDCASLAARTAADGKWVRRIARTAADGVGATEWLEIWGDAAGDEQAWLRGRLRTGNGCGELRRRLRTAWEMGGEKKPLGMSEIE